MNIYYKTFLCIYLKGKFLAVGLLDQREYAFYILHFEKCSPNFLLRRLYFLPMGFESISLHVSVSPEKKSHVQLVKKEYLVLICIPVTMSKVKL